MFCPYCGAEVAENTVFCVNCGRRVATASQPVYTAPNPYESQLQQQQMMKEANRQKQLQALSEAISHFGKKASQYADYDEVCKNVNKYAGGAKAALLIWGIIAAALGLLGMLSSLEDGESPVSVLLVFFLPGNLMIVGGILMKLRSAKALERYRNQYGHLSVELANHLLSYPNCPVGPEYTNPAVLTHFYRMIQSGRADSIQDCMLQLGNSREVNEYLSTVRQNTAGINAQTRVTTFFVAASFFM